MDTVFESFYSARARGMRASEIRELLKLTQKPDIISFAGGLPNPDAFPVEIIKDLVQDILRDHPNAALQYGTTEGMPILRDALAKEYTNNGGIHCEPDHILITAGAQQGLDLLSKVLLDPGDTVIVGAPSYLGALGSFRAFQANFANVPLDENGMDIDKLETTLQTLKSEGKRVKFLYVIPTFQNPTGLTLSLDRRKRLLDLAEEYDFLIVEDEPYTRLRYEGDPIDSLYTLSGDSGRVIYLGTMSKLLVPGFRIATMVAHPDVIRKFVIAKQSTDLCATTFTQYLTAEYIERGHMEQHLKHIINLYGSKRNIMLQALEDFMPSGVNWTKPQGGMFTWATLPEGCNTVDLLPRAIDRKVAYVVGKAFHADGGGLNSMRLNFSYASDDKIREGIKRLSEVTGECIERL